MTAVSKIRRPTGTNSKVRGSNYGVRCHLHIPPMSKAGNRKLRNELDRIKFVGVYNKNGIKIEKIRPYVSSIWSAERCSDENLLYHRQLSGLNWTILERYMPYSTNNLQYFASVEFCIFSIVKICIHKYKAFKSMYDIGKYIIKYEYKLSLINSMKA